MKVFISWSGPVSHSVAVVFRDWLPSVIQSIEPYVSSEDIDKGARWSTDIAGELHSSSYGLICLTKDNVLAPWINFEAGALGKSIDKGRVSPFLFRLKRSEVEGPILQFQSTIFEHDDVFKLLKSINSACAQDSLEEARLERAFEVWWPQLEKQLNEIKDLVTEQKQPALEAPAPNEATSRVLEEILELTRQNHRLLRDPTSLVPVDYLKHALDRATRRSDRRYQEKTESEAVRDALECYQRILGLLESMLPDVERLPLFEELKVLLREMDDQLHDMVQMMGLRSPREHFASNSEF